ncbi:integrase, catalytic region, zinc finger, CCHC-type containing protein, partial [Tanacetum coccineum]
ADIRVMDYLLQGIPNDIYNLVDACKTAYQMWERIKRLMYGSEKTEQQIHSRLVDEFDKFVSTEGESLSFVYERLTTLVNVIDRNQIRPQKITINTKFLSSLQPEWSKYVTMTRQNANVKTTVYDQLFDTLSQFELHVIAKRSKQSARNHDPLALIEANDQTIQRASRTESNTGKPNVQCYNCNARGHYARDYPQPKVHDSKFFREQMLLAVKDEAGGNLKEEENDFILDNYYGDKSLEELNAAVIIMNHAKLKTVDDDQIDSSIIFDDPYVEDNGRENEHDSVTHDQYVALRSLMDNVQNEAQNLEREIRADKDKIDNIIKEKAKLHDECVQQEYATLRI